MSYSVIRPQTHDEWLEARKDGIGSSDAGTIMGASPFSSPLMLWRIKRGLEPPVLENRAMRFGHSFEPAVAEFFARETGAQIDYSSEGDWIAVDDERPYLRVSPDRLFWPQGVEQVSDNWRILEIKTTRKAVDKDNPPLYWYCQVQYQMGVMGIRYAVIAYLTSEPSLDVDWIEVEFNPAFYATLVGMIETFWNENIIGGKEPEVKDGKDVEVRYPTHDEGKKMDADRDLLCLCLELATLKEQDKRNRESIAALESDIKTRMKDAEAIEFEDPKTGKKTAAVTYRSTSVSVVDEQLLKDELPDVYDRYVTTSFDSKRFGEDAKTDSAFGKYLKKIKGSRRFTVRPVAEAMEAVLEEDSQN